MHTKCRPVQLVYSSVISIKQAATREESNKTTSTWDQTVIDSASVEAAVFVAVAVELQKHVEAAPDTHSVVDIVAAEAIASCLVAFFEAGILAAFVGADILAVASLVAVEYQMDLL